MKLIEDIYRSRELGKERFLYIDIEKAHQLTIAELASGNCEINIEMEQRHHTFVIDKIQTAEFIEFLKNDKKFFTIKEN